MAKIIPLINFLFNRLPIGLLLILISLFVHLTAQNVGLDFAKILNFFRLLKPRRHPNILGNKILSLPIVLFLIFLQVLAVKSEFFEGFYAQFSPFAVDGLFDLLGFKYLYQVIVCGDFLN